MNSTYCVPHSPLYDPKSRVRKFRYDEDIDMIRLFLLGRGGLYEDNTFYYPLGSKAEWRRPREICTHPVFIDGKPSRFDVLQGQLGDCWAIAGFICLCSNDQLNQHVVPRNQSFDYNYTGAFHFRFWKLGYWYDVVIDDRLPVYRDNNKLFCARSRSGNVFWGALLEKAYAKFCSGGMNPVTYSSIVGGLSTASLQDISGGIVTTFATKLQNNRLQEIMIDIYSKNGMMVCDASSGQSGLLRDHSYAVTKVHKSPDNDPDYHGLFLVRVMNTWGFHEWKGDFSDDDYNYWRQIDRGLRERLNFVQRDDGEFWMLQDDIAKHFQSFTQCHLGPGQYLGSQKQQITFRTWKTKAFLGEWVRNISAGGWSLKNRHLNPQFRIVIDWTDDDADRDGRCKVLLELSSRSKATVLPENQPLTGIYVYRVPENSPVPLNQNYFENNKPLNENPFFQKCAFVKSWTLVPGQYCLVPCTQDAGQESQFLLRVFSENLDDLWEFDDYRISSRPMGEETSTYNNEEGVRKLFDSVAQGLDEIDWIDLQAVLDQVINPKEIHYGIISSFFKFVRYIQKFLPLRLVSIFKTGETVFTKDECRRMIAMLDDDRSGKLGFPEFNKLLNKIFFWSKVYEQHKGETEGHLPTSHLREALSAVGYDIDKRSVHSLSYVYADQQDHILLTDFILCGINLETVLAFHHKDGGVKKITCTLGEWVKRTLTL